MNKSKFIQELSQQTGYDEEKSIVINSILEDYFIIGRKNKEKIIQDLKVKASLNEDDAENVYDIAMKIIISEVKNKLRHPFKSQD